MNTTDFHKHQVSAAKARWDGMTKEDRAEATKKWREAGVKARQAKAKAKKKTKT